MSSFIQKVWEDKYYCIDDFFGTHEYGFIKMTEEEKLSDTPWELLYNSKLWGWWVDREVLREINKLSVHIKATNRDILIETLQKLHDIYFQDGNSICRSLMTIHCWDNKVADFHSYEEIPNEDIPCSECGGFIIKYEEKKTL